MSAIGDYVHYQYSHFTKGDSPESNAAYLTKTFGHSKVKEQYNQSLKDLKTKLDKLYRQNIKINGKIIGEEEFFKLLDDLQNDGITKAANAMVSSLETTNLSAKDITEASHDADKLQEIISRFSEILVQMTEGSFSENPLPALTYEMLQGNTSLANIKEVYRNAYLKDGTTFKVDASYKGAVGRYYNEINKILANVSAMKSIAEGGMSNFSPEVQSQALQAFSFSTLRRMNKIVGFVSENKLAEYMPTYLTNLIEKLGAGKLRIVAEGTKPGSIFSKNTEDVSIYVDMQKMLDGSAEGQISIKLPGVTLKRTNVKNNIAHINIKSGTSLSKLLDNSKISIPLREFYNAYADYNMAIIKPGRKSRLPAELNKSAEGAMQEMYNYFHAAFLPLALAGNLDRSDFA